MHPAMLSTSVELGGYDGLRYLLKGFVGHTLGLVVGDNGDGLKIAALYDGIDDHWTCLSIYSRFICAVLPVGFAFAVDSSQPASKKRPRTSDKITSFFIRKILLCNFKIVTIIP